MKSIAQIFPVAPRSLLAAFTCLSTLAAVGATTEFFDHASFQRAAGTLTTVDFESNPIGDAVLRGDEFTSQGLTILQRDGGPINVVKVGVGFAFPNNANSGSNVISSSVGEGGSFTETTDNFDFVFSQPMKAAGLWVGNVDPGVTEVQFLDSDGNILASESFTGGHPGIIGSLGGDNRIFYGIVSDSPITRIRTVEGVGDSDGVTYDDVQFSADVAPRSLRVLTMNIWQWGNDISARQDLLMNQVRALSPDLIAFQEAKDSGAGDGLRSLGYNVISQPHSPEGYGILIGSRWAIEWSRLESLEVPGADEFPYAALFARVRVPPPFGVVMFVNAKPAWMPQQATQRMEQAELLMNFVDLHSSELPVILSGDFDDVPTSESLQFITGQNGFRDAWDEAGDDSGGYTFTTNNPHAQPVIVAYGFPDYRRIDYLFLRHQENECFPSRRGPYYWNTCKVIMDGGESGPIVSGHFAVCGELRESDSEAHLTILPSLTGVAIRWPTCATNFVLETTSNLSPPIGWESVTNEAVIVDGMLSITVPYDRPSRFFRMRQQQP